MILRFLIMFLLAGSGAWMACDGARAFIVGDYFTPREGPYAGRLGPWSRLVQGVGIDPRSGLMKSAHLACGMLCLAAAILMLAKAPLAPLAVVIAGVATLWYLPIGTISGSACLVLLYFSSRNA